VAAVTDAMTQRAVEIERTVRREGSTATMSMPFE